MKKWRVIQGLILSVGLACCTCAYAAEPGKDTKNGSPPTETKGKGDVQPSGSSAAAPDATAEESSKNWRLELSTYGWLSSISSKVERGEKETVNEVKFKDIVDAVDFAAFTHFEAQRGKWGLFTELDFVKISDANEVRLKRIPLVRIDTAGGVKETMAELGGIRSFDWERVGFDVLLGARYYRYVIDAKAGPFETRMTKDWVDPLVGGRIRVRLSEKWGASIRGDVGGFGVGSELSANVLAAVGYRISDRCSLGFGYRYLRVEDDMKGSKLTSETYGPLIGMSIRF